MKFNFSIYLWLLIFYVINVHMWILTALLGEKKPFMEKKHMFSQQQHICLPRKEAEELCSSLSNSTGIVHNPFTSVCSVHKSPARVPPILRMDMQVGSAQEWASLRVY